MFWARSTFEVKAQNRQEAAILPHLVIALFTFLIRFGKFAFGIYLILSTFRIPKGVYFLR